MVPDDAISRFDELTPKAALLFVYYCKRRNADEGGTAWPSLSTIAREMNIPKTSACELRKQLVDRGWVELVSGDTVRVVMGFPPFGKVESDSENPNAETPDSFGKVERRSEKSNDKDVSKSRTPFGKVECRSEKSNGAEDERSEKSNEPFGKVESHIRKNQLNEPAYKEIHVESPDSTARQVKTIFTYWQERLNHPNSKLTGERRRCIEARLRESYTVEDVKRAIDGCAASPFHRGENDKGRPYDSLDLICRNGSKLESFIALVTPRNGNGNHSNGAIPPKNQFCGQCDHGYLPPPPGKSEAVRCSCVNRRGVPA